MQNSAKTCNGSEGVVDFSRKSKNSGKFKKTVHNQKTVENLRTGTSKNCGKLKTVSRSTKDVHTEK